MALRKGAKVDVLDFDLPDPAGATAGGAGTNTVTATSWAVLPTNTVTVAITNPHPSADMLCWVSYGAWMSASASDVRMGLDVSGSVTIPPGIGSGGPRGWGQILQATAATSQQFSGGCTVVVPPGTATFKAYAYRSAASGTQAVNYPTLDVVPVRYLL